MIQSFIQQPKVQPRKAAYMDGIFVITEFLFMFFISFRSTAESANKKFGMWLGGRQYPN